MDEISLLDIDTKEDIRLLKKWSNMKKTIIIAEAELIIMAISIQHLN